MAAGGLRVSRGMAKTGGPAPKGKANAVEYDMQQEEFGKPGAR